MRTLILLVLLVPPSMLGCGGVSDARSREALTAFARDENGVLILTLSQPLNAIPASGPGVTILAADLELGGAESDLMHVTDVATFPDGRFAVLDRLAFSVWLYSPRGALIKTLGREGSGPMEFKRPRAVAAMGEHLVVWDRNSSKEFTVFDTAGTVLGTTPVPIDGDWMALQLRVDTLATSVAPPNVLRSDVPRGPDIYPHFNQPIFSPRPVWAATERWIAIGHGDSSAIEVRDRYGAQILRVEWPRDERGISDEDRFQHACVRMQEEVDKAGKDAVKAQFISYRARRRARNDDRL